MEPIGLIQDTAYLDGTAYFEFQPGRFKGDFWLAGSAFLPEGVFCYLEPTIRHLGSWYVGGRRELSTSRDTQTSSKYINNILKKYDLEPLKESDLAPLLAA